jgi:hypothetical protein
MYSAESDFYCLARDKMSIPSTNELHALPSLNIKNGQQKKKKKKRIKRET